MSGVTSIYDAYAGHTHLSTRDGGRTSQWPAINIFNMGGGRSRISGITFQGPAIDVFNIGGECSRFSGIASQGAWHRRLRYRWWALSGLRQRLSGFPSSTSLT
jgi:hypothetical protein